MVSGVELESELRVLEVDLSDVISRIKRLGAKKVFDGIITTSKLERRESPYYSDMGNNLRVRHERGFGYEFDSGEHTGVRQPLIDHTLVETKIRLRGNAVTRNYEQALINSYEGDALDLVVAKLTNPLLVPPEGGHIEYGRDRKSRISFNDAGLIRFELDKLSYVKELCGEVDIPLFLEIQTNDPKLTFRVLRALGYDPNETLHGAVEKRVGKWGLNEICKYYSNKFGILYQDLKPRSSKLR